KIHRGKVPTRKGAIIGEFWVDGEQLSGEARTSVEEVFIAAEHEASDRINRNRVPRQYHKAVKAYFSGVRRSVEELHPPASPTPAASSTPPPKPKPEP
ncbi:MAG: hypothetical protein D6788_09955, partial [Planctomycetota bacterium]